MKRDPVELSMHVEGMTCQGCVEAVRRTIHRLDPQAVIDIDLSSGSVKLTTETQSLDVADALGKAGYSAVAMTG